MNKTLCYGLIALIAALGLMTGCAATPPAGTGGTGSADASAGKTLYDNNCAACHRLGNYDTAGNAPDLAGRQAEITAAWVLSHRGLTFSATDVANIQAFVASK